jgi:hypothetical protein
VTRSEQLAAYGRFYGGEHFAVAFTASTGGDDAKRVITAGWDKTKPLADGDFAAGLIAKRGQERNIAIVLRPSNLVVIECDSEEDLTRIENLDLPVTLTVRSSEPYKRHFYFRPPVDLEVVPYVAFRFESGKLTADSGRYFLAPPSIHPSGTVYDFLPGLGPDDVDIAELPEHDYRMLVEQARLEDAEQRTRIEIDPEAKIHAGNRRDLIFRYACMLRRWGLTREQIAAQCHEFNEQRCEPPVERALVETQVDGAMKKRGDQELAAENGAAPEHDAPPLVDAPPWHAQPWPEFRDQSPDEHRWIIEGLIPEAMLGFVAGPPKKGKTWIGIAAAIAVAGGRPLIDYPVAAARPVIYVALEGSRPGLRARIGALARGLDLDPDSDDLDQLHMLYRPRPFNLVELEHAIWLHDEATRLEAALVIIDVLRAAARYEENDAGAFAHVRNSLEPLLAAGRTVLLLHHFGKLTDTQKERSPGERMAGTGAMYGALDIGLLITRSDQGARSMRIDIETRDFAAPDALGIRITGTGSGEHGGFTYTDRAVLEFDAGAVTGKDYAAEAETLFADGAWRTGTELAKELGAKRDLIEKALEDDELRRFHRVANGRLVGRSPLAKPWGTMAMWEARDEPLRLAPDPEQVEQVDVQEGDAGYLLPRKGRASKQVTTHPPGANR